MQLFKFETVALGSLGIDRCMLGIRSAHGLCQTGHSCANPRRIEPEVRILRAMFVVVAMCVFMVPVRIFMVPVVVIRRLGVAVLVPVVLVVVVAMCVFMVPVRIFMVPVVVIRILAVPVAIFVVLVPFLVAMGILGTSHRQVGQGIDELFQANHDRLVGPRLLEQLIKPTGLQSHANHDHHIGVGHTRDILGPRLEHVHIAPGGHK